MTAWTKDELSRIDAADELEIAPLRRDGTLRNPTTIWVVRLGDDLFIRSVNGRTAAWFRGTQVGTKATSRLAASTRTSPSWTRTPTSTTRSTPHIAPNTTATRPASSAAS